MPNPSPSVQGLGRAAYVRHSTPWIFSFTVPGIFEWTKRDPSDISEYAWPGDRASMLIEDEYRCRSGTISEPCLNQLVHSTMFGYLLES
jgi:hypothetical protein